MEYMIWAYHMVGYRMLDYMVHTIENIKWFGGRGKLHRGKGTRATDKPESWQT